MRVYNPPLGFIRFTRVYKPLLGFIRVYFFCSDMILCIGFAEEFSKATAMLLLRPSRLPNTQQYNLGAPIGAPLGAPLGASEGGPLGAPLGAPMAPLGAPIVASVGGPLEASVGAPMGAPMGAPWGYGRLIAAEAEKEANSFHHYVSHPLSMVVGGCCAALG